MKQSVAFSSPESVRMGVETALPIARERAQLLESIRSALLEGDDASALVLMRQYCGLPSAIGIVE